MNLYFYAPEPKSEELTQAYRSIAAVLERTGATVWTRESTAGEAFGGHSRQSPLERVQAIIIEGTEPDPEVGYLLAYAIAQKKPALLLTLKGRVRRSPLETFGKEHGIPSTLQQAHYLPSTAEKALQTFLERFDTEVFPQIPSIKFTLRITDEIEDFLHWKTHNTKLSKADYLRKAIQEDIMGKDDAYKKYRRSRRMPKAE